MPHLSRPTKRKPGPTQIMFVEKMKSEMIGCDFCYAYDVEVYSSTANKYGAKICHECINHLYITKPELPLSTSG